MNERFTRAADFLVFDIETAPSTHMVFRERRPRPPGEIPSRAYGEALADLLSDCCVLVSLQFPGVLRRFLGGKGFAFLETRAPIDSLAGEILSHGALQDGTPGPVAGGKPSTAVESS